LPVGMVRRLARLRRSLIFAASWALEPPLARITRRAPTPGAGVDLRELREFDERIEPLWRGLMPGIGLGLCKEGSYLNWRYVRHPAASYAILAAERRGELLGFTVMRQSGLRADIAELVVHPDRADVADLLLAAAVEQTRRAGRVVLTAWALAGHPTYAAYRRMGFISQGRLHRLARSWPALHRNLYQVIVYDRYLAAAQQVRLNAEIDAWSLSMGDSDLV
jgi:hypothetical protein